MKKYYLIIPIIVLLLVLFGCGKEDIREIDGAKLAEKEETMSGRFSQYTMTFEKDGQRIQLYPKNSNQFNAVGEGTIVDLKYDAEDYYIEDMVFTKLENEREKNE